MDLFLSLSSRRLESHGIQYSIIAAAVFSSSAGIVSKRSILSRPEPQPTNAMLIKCTTPAHTTSLKEKKATLEAKSQRPLKIYVFLLSYFFSFFFFYASTVATLKQKALPYLKSVEFSRTFSLTYQCM